MARDPYADLVDTNDVTQLLGLANRGSISVYRRRYPNFPAPVVEKAGALLWRRQDIERWATARKGKT